MCKCRGEPQHLFTWKFVDWFTWKFVLSGFWNVYYIFESHVLRITLWIWHMKWWVLVLKKSLMFKFKFILEILLLLKFLYSLKNKLCEFTTLVKSGETFFITWYACHSAWLVSSTNLGTKSKLAKIVKKDPCTGPMRKLKIVCEIWWWLIPNRLFNRLRR